MGEIIHEKVENARGVKDGSLSGDLSKKGESELTPPQKKMKS